MFQLHLFEVLLEKRDIPWLHFVPWITVSIKTEVASISKPLCPIEYPLIVYWVVFLTRSLRDHFLYEIREQRVMRVDERVLVFVHI